MFKPKKRNGLLRKAIEGGRRLSAAEGKIANEKKNDVQVESGDVRKPKPDSGVGQMRRSRDLEKRLLTSQQGGRTVLRRLGPNK